MNEQLLI